MGIYPQTNYRGQYDGGLGNGCTLIHQQSIHPAEPIDPNEEEIPGCPVAGGGTVQHWVEVDWPGKSMHPSMERRSTRRLVRPGRCRVARLVPGTTAGAR